MIEHLVLSGGFEKGLLQLGILSVLEERSEFNVQELKTIHGTSIGAFVGAALCTGMTASAAANYFISRPMERDVEAACFTDRERPQKGLIDGTLFRSVFSNLLRAIDLPDDGTLADLYGFSGIDLHMFTVSMEGLALVDLSASTHPDLPVWKAIHMSAAVPGVFEPAYLDNGIYVDGGLRNNYPIGQCLAMPGVNRETVFGITAFSFGECFSTANPDSSILSYVQDWFLATMSAIADPVEVNTEGIRTVHLPKSSPLRQRMPELLLLYDSVAARQELYEKGKLLAPV